MDDPDPLPPVIPPSWSSRLPAGWHDHLTAGRLVAGLAAVGTAVVVAVVLLRPPPATAPLVLPPAGATGPGDAGLAPPTTRPAVTAHVAGAVAHPGVYALPGGARVTDLVMAAGGPTPQADVGGLNLAAPVADGERVWVPVAGEPPPPAVADPGPGGGAPAGGPVDVNRASVEVLDTLPGVGPATAQAILAYRQEHGPFTAVAQLLDVPGIGPAKLEALRGLVTVGR